MSTLEVKAIQAPTGYDLDMPAGHIVQTVQNALNASSYTTTSTSYQAVTDMSVTITPKFSSSKVLVTFNCGGAIVGDSTNQNAVHIRIKRGSTVIRELGRYGYNRNDDYSSIPIFLTYLDSPSTTSATTYTIEMKTMLALCTLIEMVAQMVVLLLHRR